jgi:hypothetical protein
MGTIFFFISGIIFVLCMIYSKYRFAKAHLIIWTPILVLIVGAVLLYIALDVSWVFIVFLILAPTVGLLLEKHVEKKYGFNKLPTKYLTMDQLKKYRKIRYILHFIIIAFALTLVIIFAIGAVSNLDENTSLIAVNYILPLFYLLGGAVYVIEGYLGLNRYKLIVPEVTYDVTNDVNASTKSDSDQG